MSEIRSITLNLKAAVYDALIVAAKASGSDESDLVEEALQLLFDRTANQSLLATVEGLISARLENFEHSIDERFSSSIEQHISKSEFQQLKAELARLQILIDRDPVNPAQLEVIAPPIAEIAPSIRQLEVGDFVQIRDVDSPYFMEKLQIVKVGIVRASVATHSGEQSFLKRELRFVPPDSEISK